MKAKISKLHSKGFLVKVWMTSLYTEIENNQMYSKLVDYGVDVIVTNKITEAQQFNNHSSR